MYMPKTTGPTAYERSVYEVLSKFSMDHPKTVKDVLDELLKGEVAILLGGAPFEDFISTLETEKILASAGDGYILTDSGVELKKEFAERIGVPIS